MECHLISKSYKIGSASATDFGLPHRGGGGTISAAGAELLVRKWLKFLRTKTFAERKEKGIFVVPWKKYC